MTVCIVTDSSVVLPQTTFTGHALVKVVSHSDSHTQPGQPEFLHAFETLGQGHTHMLVLTAASALGSMHQSAAQAAQTYRGGAHITLINTQQACAGLGMLVMLAAEQAAAGAQMADIERSLRAVQPHIFTIISTAQPSGLVQAGLLEPAHVTVLDAMHLQPVFILEHGQLSPLQKVRTARHLLETLQEFMEEFDTPRFLSVVKGAHCRLHTRPLRQFTEELWEDAPAFNEHLMPPTQSTLWGEDSMMFTLMERSR